MTRAVVRLGGLLTLGALASGALVSAPVGAAETQDRASSGFAPVLSWEGGVTEACWTTVGETDAEVRVRWDGRRYDYDPHASGGLGRVSGRFAISDQTYSSAPAGQVGPVVSLTMSRDGYVYLLVGSQVGITREVVVPVRTLNQCEDARGAAAAPTVAERTRAGRACVSKKEFRKIKRGMTPAGVQKVVGAKGRKVTGAPYSLVQRFRPCAGSENVVVNFQRAREKSPNKVVSRFR
jgi:hypothetical protein